MSLCQNCQCFVKRGSDRGCTNPYAVMHEAISETTGEAIGDVMYGRKGNNWPLLILGGERKSCPWYTPPHAGERSQIPVY